MHFVKTVRKVNVDYDNEDFDFYSMIIIMSSTAFKIAVFVTVSYNIKGWVN